MAEREAPPAELAPAAPAEDETARALALVPKAVLGAALAHAAGGLASGGEDAGAAAAARVAVALAAQFSPDILARALGGGVRMGTVAASAAAAAPSAQPRAAGAKRPAQDEAADEPAAKRAQMAAGGDGGRVAGGASGPRRALAITADASGAGVCRTERLGSNNGELRTYAPAEAAAAAGDSPAATWLQRLQGAVGPPVIGMQVQGMLSAAEFAALCAAVEGSATLRKLSFSYCDDQQTVALAAALARNTSLTALHLVCCGNGDVGAEALAAALVSNTTLLKLDLRNSAGIKGPGLVALGNVLNNENNTLEMLLFSEMSSVSPAAKAAMRRSLRGGRARMGTADSSHPWGDLRDC